MHGAGPPTVSGAEGPLRQGPLGGRELNPGILKKEDEELTREEWQEKLAYKHLANNYPQQYGKDMPTGTISRLGLLESTGPLLGDSPHNLSRFRVLKLAATVIAVGVTFGLMPETINGRRHMFSDVRQRTPAVSFASQHRYSLAAAWAPFS